VNQFIIKTRNAFKQSPSHSISIISYSNLWLSLSDSKSERYMLRFLLLKRSNQPFNLREDNWDRIHAETSFSSSMMVWVCRVFVSMCTSVRGPRRCASRGLNPDSGSVGRAGTEDSEKRGLTHTIKPWTSVPHRDRRAEEIGRITVLCFSVSYCFCLHLLLSSPMPCAHFHTYIDIRRLLTRKWYAVCVGWCTCMTT